MTTLSVELPLATGLSKDKAKRIAHELRVALVWLGVTPYLVYPDWKRQCVRAYAFTHLPLKKLHLNVTNKLVDYLDQEMIDLGASGIPTYPHRWYLVNTDTVNVVVAFHPIPHRTLMKGEHHGQENGDRPANH